MHRRANYNTKIHYLYDGQNVNYELGGANTTVRYVHPQAGQGCKGCGGSTDVFTDHPISMKIDGEKYYYLYDGQGSVTEVIDANENLVNQYRYTPFGEPRVKVETVHNPYEYAGRRFDDESGKYYYRARQYSPEQARFMSQDPVGDGNRYAYVGNNPVNRRDPSGMQPIQQQPPKIMIDGTGGSLRYGTNSGVSNYFGGVKIGSEESTLTEVSDATYNYNLDKCPGVQDYRTYWDCVDEWTRITPPEGTTVAEYCVEACYETGYGGSNQFDEEKYTECFQDKFSDIGEAEIGCMISIAIGALGGCLFTTIAYAACLFTVAKLGFSACGLIATTSNILASAYCITKAI